MAKSSTPAEQRRNWALVLSCEHASAAIPTRYRKLCDLPQSVLASHRALDLGAAACAQELARSLGAPCHYGRVTRLLVDLNRDENLPAVFSGFARHLSEPQRQQLLRTYHQPFRAAVSRAVGAALARERPILHLSVHSFTPYWRGRRRRVDIGLLYDPQRPREVSMAKELRASLERRWPKLRILLNEPYRGWTDGHTTHLRRKLQSRNYVGIELELNQALLSRRGVFPANLCRGLSAAVAATLGGGRLDPRAS